MAKNGFRRITSKLDGFQRAIPCYACSSCFTKHDAPKVARCTKCNHSAPAMVRVSGKRRDNTCPNCARPNLKNEHAKPFSCISCSATEFEYFHSTGEFNVFAKLMLLNNSGRITNLRRQVKFPVKLKGDEKPLFTYTADYVFEEGDSKRIIDYKGHKDAIDGRFKLVKKIVERWYGVEIEIMTGG